MKVAGILKHPAFGLVIVGALLGVLTTVLATHTHDIHGFEKQLLLGVYNWSLIWIMPMIVLTQGGNLWAIILLTLVAFGRRRDTVWLKLAAAGLLASLMATILKNIVMSVRPVELGIGVVARFPWSVGYAFPSGHTAIATALAVIIFASVKRSHRWWALLLPVLVGLSRLYLGVHRPLDLAGGLAVGLVSGGLVLLLSENLKIKIPMPLLNTPINGDHHRHNEYIDQVTSDPRIIIEQRIPREKNKDITTDMIRNEKNVYQLFLTCTTCFDN